MTNMNNKNIKLIILYFIILYFFTKNICKYFYEKYTNVNDNENIITFIIPTIGRKSLMESIESIQNQTIEKWNAIIIFDGIDPNISINDNRIKIIKITKKGKHKNSAGNVRNVGMRIAKTKWIAFLDDDDFIENDYIETFYKELDITNNLDVLIFRMIYEDNVILPELNTDNFYVRHVGISFVINKKIIDDGILFSPSSIEDFKYLNKIRNHKYKIVISPYVKYMVNKINDNAKKFIGNRLIIN